jgi:L-amino acid N-acyltransferase YncA
MPLMVRSAIGAGAAACVEVYRPYALDTLITFETEPPTVEEMAARIVTARLLHEWLVLEVDGDVAGYAYAHQFNSRVAYQWWSRPASTGRRTACAWEVDERCTPSC